ncbi:hypothetical protein CkaCkLH20_02748 [Colletotrichum karsti]|uniref:Uncharacterized protein n=1 Tax=Colletotrichum karsti TaxID=1095194 RepID=A0A9P6ICN8_9PEZI|nr:uncharacterized protein CkaCkLH20_02748 [Colletotrichum karsti]KAF9879937.1 hypothetical protein CkaCkLH20_02748 [Colletotrichum karsti]
MTGHYLFETTDSVIEILWDVALAFFIVRIAWAYFLLTFATGTLLSWVVCKYEEHLLPVSRQHLSTPETELMLVPLQALVGIIWARYVVVSYEIPRVAWFRLAIGGLAAFFMITSEALLGFLLYEEGYGDWIWETDGKAWLAFVGLLGAFALMPTAMMGFERKTADEGERETATSGSKTLGLEGKSLNEAVPAVSIASKEEPNKQDNVRTSRI